MPTNECTPYYDDGEDITGFCTAAVIGKRFLKVSADRPTGGPAGVSDDIGGGNIKVAPCAAGDQAFGVSSHDQLINKLVGVIRGQKVVPVTAGAAISAGQLVQSDAVGKAVPYVPPNTTAVGAAVAATPHILGLAVADAANNADAQISLYV